MALSWKCQGEAALSAFAFTLDWRGGLVKPREGAGEGAAGKETPWVEHSIGRGAYAPIEKGQLITQALVDGTWAITAPALIAGSPGPPQPSPGGLLLGPGCAAPLRAHSHARAGGPCPGGCGGGSPRLAGFWSQTAPPLAAGGSLLRRSNQKWGLPLGPGPVFLGEPARAGPRPAGGKEQ